MVNDTLAEVKEWFVEAKPNPNVDSMRVQLGVHFEEISEMMHALGMGEYWITSVIASRMKDGSYQGMKSYTDVNRKELLDALCDQIVTAVGVAHMYGLDILSGMKEVNRSNWSKFVNGQPIFDNNGKILKGPDYSPPDLSKYC